MSLDLRSSTPTTRQPGTASNVAVITPPGVGQQSLSHKAPPAQLKASYSDTTPSPALHFPGMLPPDDVFNPSSVDDKELNFPVDAPTVSCKIVEMCHYEFLKEIEPEFLTRVQAGYKGIRNPDDPNSTVHMECDVGDAAVWLLTLLLNRKPTSVEEGLARKEGLPVHTYVYGFICIAGGKYNRHACEILISPAGLANLKRVMATLAHTNPGRFGKVLKKGTKTKATKWANIWFGATNSLGSMYRKSKTPISKTQTQSSIVKFLARPAQAALEAAPGLQDASTSPGPSGSGTPSSALKHSSTNASYLQAAASQDTPTSAPANGTPTPSAPPASAAAPIFQQRNRGRTRKHKRRVRAKLTVNTPADESPNGPTVAKIKEFVCTLQGEDPTVRLLAWLLKNATQYPPIEEAADFPEDIEGLKPYTDRLRPRSGKSVIWLVLLFECDGNPDNLLSTSTSNMNWWYKDNHAACYLYDVQDSDDAVEVGTLAFSGVHCDHFRLFRLLDPLFKAHNRGERLKFGLTVKMSKGYPKSE